MSGSEPRLIERAAPFAAALLSGLLLLAVVIAIDASERERYQQAQHSQLVEQTALVRARLESHLNKVIASARSVALVFATHPRLERADFERLAREVLGPNPSIVNVGLIRGTVIQHVHPLAGNEKALGLDISRTPSMWPVFQRMMATRSTVVAGPVALVQGGEGIIVRIPVFLADPARPPGAGDFLGAVSIPLDAREVFRQSGLDALAQQAQVALRGRDGLGKTGDTFYGNAALFAQAVARQDIMLPGGNWEIAARPLYAGVSPSLPGIRALGATLCAAVATLAFAAVHTGQRRRRDARSLRAMNQRLEAVLQAVPDLLFELDAEGRYEQVWVGPHAELLARPVPELLGRGIAELLPPAAAREMQAALDEAARLGRSHGRQIQLPLARGETWFELSVAPIAAPSGDAMHYLVLSRDVTQRHQVEQELRIAATAFQTQDGMLITDCRYRILRVNHAFTDITGYTAEEVLGHTPVVLRSGRQDAAFYRRMRDALRESGRWSGEIWNRRKNGEVYPEWLSISAVRGEHGGVSHYVGAFIDITQHKRAESEIHRLAFHDPLTGLANRRLLLERLDIALASGAHRVHHGALLFIDLDDFKSVNDTRGHVLGDLLLQQTAQRLTLQVRNDDTVARLGGDEFVVLLQGLSTDAAQARRQALEIGEKIRSAVATGFVARGQRYQLGCSIGVRLFGHGEPVEELLKNADTAMHAAKRAGRNKVCFFDPTMQALLEQRVQIEADMREGIAQRQFRLFYQVQVDATGRPVGAEALLRWQHPRRGLLPPGDFVALAEETGLIVPLGDWVLKAAMAQLALWQLGETTRGLTLAVNISGRQLRDPGFAARLQTLLQRTGIDPGRLELEITESMLLDDVEEVIALMHQLKRLGLRFSIDDFGTGYSSLQYLKRLPLDALKIDRLFVADVDADESARSIVRTIVGMACGMGLGTVAEGVETGAQQQVLAELGCHCLQGYLFGRPLPLEEFEAALARLNRLAKAAE